MLHVLIGCRISIRTLKSYGKMKVSGRVMNVPTNTSLSIVPNSKWTTVGQYFLRISITVRYDFTKSLIRLCKGIA